MPGASAFRALSFNIQADGVTTHVGFPDWPERRDVCARVLPALGADLLAFQECIGTQQRAMRDAFPDFDAALTDWRAIDESIQAPVRARLGRNLPETGELLTLFRRERFELVEHREAFLSPTPERASIGFGNSVPRSILALKLVDRNARRGLWVVNTHLDFRCTEPMARVAIAQLARWLEPDAPALWLGDFNAGLSTPTCACIRAAGFQAPELERDRFRGERVDHVFERGVALIRREYRHIASAAHEPVLSDHDPVLAEFDWE